MLYAYEKKFIMKKKKKNKHLKSIVVFFKLYLYINCNYFKSNTILLYNAKIVFNFNCVLNSYTHIEFQHLQSSTYHKLET